jgi:hypothetical protein
MLTTVPPGTHTEISGVVTSGKKGLEGSNLCFEGVLRKLKPQQNARLPELLQQMPPVFQQATEAFRERLAVQQIGSADPSPGKAIPGTQPTKASTPRSAYSSADAIPVGFDAIEGGEKVAAGGVDVGVWGTETKQSTSRADRQKTDSTVGSGAGSRLRGIDGHQHQDIRLQPTGHEAASSNAQPAANLPHNTSPQMQPQRDSQSPHWQPQSVNRPYQVPMTQMQMQPMHVMPQHMQQHMQMQQQSPQNVHGELSRMPSNPLNAQPAGMNVRQQLIPPASGEAFNSTFPAGSSSAQPAANLPAANLSHATPQMAQRESQSPHWQSHNQSYSGPITPMMTQMHLMHQQMMLQMSMQPPPPQMVHGDMSRVPSNPLNSQPPLRNGGGVQSGSVLKASAADFVPSGQMFCPAPQPLGPQPLGLSQLFDEEPKNFADKFEKQKKSGAFKDSIVWDEIFNNLDANKATKNCLTALFILSQDHREAIVDNPRFVRNCLSVLLSFLTQHARTRETNLSFLKLVSRCLFAASRCLSFFDFPFLYPPLHCASLFPFPFNFPRLTVQIHMLKPTEKIQNWETRAQICAIIYSLSVGPEVRHKLARRVDQCDQVVGFLVDSVINYREQPQVRVVTDLVEVDFRFGCSLFLQCNCSL